MITWTSDKSGIASSGVRITAYTPAAITNSVDRSTRKTLRTDHSMMRPSMSVALMRVGGGLRPGRLDADDGVLATGLAGEVEHDALARFERAQQRSVLDLEVHGHGRPFQAGDRSVREGHAGVGRIQGLDPALAAMRRGRTTGGGCNRLGRACRLRLCAFRTRTEA